jgi:thioredoxin-related protein
MCRLLFTLLFAATVFAVPSSQSTHSFSFPPFDQWRAAVLSGDFSALARLYSQSPEPQLAGLDRKPIALPDELAFWSSWKSKGLANLSADLIEESEPQPNLHFLVLQLTLTLKQNPASQKEFVAVVQGWLRQNDRWSLVVVQRTAATRLRQPLDGKEIYNPSLDPHEEIAAALRSAAASHKRVLVVFGGNWCFDCHVLDEAFHSAEIAPTLTKSFVVVHVDIGQMDRNLDVARRYDVPIDRGVPALAVLDSNGRLLFSQKRGEFEAARSMAPEDILAFLRIWQPPSR